MLLRLHSLKDILAGSGSRAGILALLTNKTSFFWQAPRFTMIATGIDQVAKSMDTVKRLWFLHNAKHE